MIKFKKLKTVIIITVMVFIGLLYTSNSYAYQESMKIPNSNSDFSVIEVDVETGEEKEKTYAEIMNSLNTSNSDRSIEQNYVEPYYPINNTINSESSRVIIGGDNKIPATHAQICAIEITWSDGCVSGATAFMIGPDLAATAGHCVYDYYGESNHSAHGLAKSIKVTPGKSGNSEPYGVAYAKTFVYETSWKGAGNVKEDWGLIKLDRRIGEKCGSMGFACSDDYSGWVGKYVTVTGYPKPFSRDWKLYTHREKVMSAKDLYMTYKVDTESGQSGSPVIEDGTGYAIGIHHGGDSVENSGYNLGVNITRARFNTFKSYR